MMQAQHHPGAGPHPGMQPGMGPGVPNPGQGMGQPMQMYPGGPGGPGGPNGPHVTQPGQVMGGMQPGGMGPMQGQPSAHAMAHLGPQQAAFHQQQQMQQAHLMQQRQQAMMRQHQQQQMMQQNMGGMAFPGGNPTFTPQQINGMQSGQQPPFNIQLPPHLAAQLSQARAAQQQHHQQQQLQAQQHVQAHAQQQQQQAQQMQLQQQQMQGNQGQPVSQPPQTQGSQAPPPQQMRPPSQMSLRETQPSPAPSNGPQQAPTPQPVLGQQNQGPNQSQPNAPQNPQSQGQPGQQSQPQAQPGSQQTSGPPNPQLQHQMQPSQIQQQQQQHNQQQAAQQRLNQIRFLQAQQQHAQAQATQGQQGGGANANTPRGHLITRLINYVDKLGAYNSSFNSLLDWQNFIKNNFADEGSFRFVTMDMKDNSLKKLYEIPAVSLPRFYYVHFRGEIEAIQYCLGGLQETPSPQGGVVHCSRAKLIYWFKNRTQLVCSGKLSALFTPDIKIDTLIFETEQYQDFISRDAVEGLFSPDSPVQSNKPSPKMTKKKASAKHGQIEPVMPTITKTNLPETPIGPFGVTMQIQNFLEVNETILHMRDHISHSIENASMTPSQALTNYVEKFQDMVPMRQNMPGGPNPMQNNMPPGARTPSGMPGANGGPVQGQQFMSPHLANLGPPTMNGSPHMMQTHTPSPAGTHNLVAQHSQQGTNSSATASANTSPNQSNKRRRASGVKVEDDDNVNGVGNKVKQSPRPPNNKRIKSGA